MAEELARETIQQIVNQTLQASQTPTIITLDPAVTAAIIGAIALVAGSLIKSFYERRQSIRIEFMKHLDCHNEKFANLTKEFGDTTQTYSVCKSVAMRHLQIVDQISFLRIKKLVGDDFTQYFENEFNTGRTYLTWLEITNDNKGAWKNVYPNFEKIKGTIKYNGVNAVAPSSFYYHVNDYTDSEFDPDNKIDPREYEATDDDLEMLVPNEE
ncbi:MAG: hypothetical protein KC444_09765 [Nitrosopumilus sp.]|nr:hypothetical protein [Nitrosopumilus sp.]